MELEAKESRLQDALKIRRKAAKEKKQHQNNEPDASYAALESDNMKLREREHALLNAVHIIFIFYSCYFFLMSNINKRWRNCPYKIKT
jgi:hypothetical protein